MHADARFVLVAGFVGSRPQWRRFQRDWQFILGRDGVSTFHYTDLRYGRKSYSGWSQEAKARHLKSLAGAIEGACVTPVVACFSGDWAKTVAGNADWIERFPSAYAWCFEAAMQALDWTAKKRFAAQQVAVSMCSHEEYERRAVEVYDHFKFNGAWPGIDSLCYVEPRDCLGAQAADMIAWEVQRDLNQADLPPAKQVPLPLLDKVSRPDQTFAWLRYDEAALREQMSLGRGPPLIRPPEYRSD